MILPEEYQGKDWYPSFSRFMTALRPDWYKRYDCAPYTPKEVQEVAVKFAPDIPLLPEEYLTFLTHMGGRGLDLNHRAYLYHGGRLYLSGEEETCLTIGCYNPLDEVDRLAYCFPQEGPPYLVWRDRWSEPAGGQIKVADNLGQLLCNQAFLAYGVDQFPLHQTMCLAFHQHLPPYEPCPEAVEYCRTHPTADLSDKELEDIGFQIEAEKLEDPLQQQGYEKVWFSTGLEHIWLKGNTCCILSREFDPNDMFDTVTISIWGEQKKPIQMLASRFKELGYGSYREVE